MLVRLTWRLRCLLLPHGLPPTWCVCGMEAFRTSGLYEDIVSIVYVIFPTIQQY